MSFSPKVSIILINWNRFQDTADCIESLLRSSYPNKEIFVTDNGSKNHEAEKLQQRFGSQIRVISSSKNLGFAGGNNLAANEALHAGSSDYLLFLNNDTEVDPGFLEPLVMAMEKDSRIGISGPKVLWKQHPDQILFAGGRVRLFLGDATHLGLFAKDGPPFNQLKVVDYIEGSALCLRSSIARSLGLFDKKFFAYWEDTDLCLRVRKAGYDCVFVPNSHIFHKVSQSTGGDESPISIYYMSRNRYRFIKKHSRWLHGPTLLLFSLAWSARCIFHFLREKNFRAAKTFLIGTMHGLRGVTGEIPQNLL